MRKTAECLEVCRIMLIFAAINDIVMSTTIVYDNNRVSPLDALWSLFLSQPKSVRCAFAKRLLSQETSVYAELQRAAVGNSFKKALKELDEAEKSGLENLPDATTLFD